MSETIIHRLSDFTLGANFDQLPDDVIHESKRIVLDSIGCALAAIHELKGDIGIKFGHLLGGSSSEATIIGSAQRSSIFGAAFANGELINTLDFDIVLVPGHVTPYVLPVALAVGESVGASGKKLIEATAVSHEMSYRFGKTMDNLRDTKDGKVVRPPVFGYSSTVFGATAAAGMLRGLSHDVLASAFGIAACTCPVNAHGPWFEHPPPSTIKYLMAGAVTQSALTAVHLAEFGHRGDLQVLDDREVGFARIIGTQKWDTDQLLSGLGDEWRFPPHLSYKPYPHCRVLHSSIGCMTDVLEENNIRVDEIDGIKVWVEGMCERPVWLTRNIEHVQDGQFSIAHGIALGAHRIPPSKAWQDPEWVFRPSVMELMKKVTIEVHPQYVEMLEGHGERRPAHLEINARGTTFIGEQLYPKGVRSEDPDSYMTDEEICGKFATNAEGVLLPAAVDDVIDMVMNLERIDDIGALMGKFAVEPIKARADEESVEPGDTRTASLA